MTLVMIYSNQDGESDEKSEKPPSSICDIVATRVHSGSSNRSNARRREVDFLQHLSNPDLRFRLRNDSIILELNGQNN